LPNKSLLKRLKPLIRKTQLYTKRIAQEGIWVAGGDEYRVKSAEGKVRQPFFRGYPRGLMNWGHVVRNTAIAIGITFVAAVGVYLAIRFFMSAI
jgi:hypothetical protein